MNRYEKAALEKLPERLAVAAVNTAALYGGVLHEVRLRLNRPLVITVNDRNISCGIRCSKDDIDNAVLNLCGKSLYSHSHTIREGYICAGDGIRAGVCGQAVVENGKIVAVRDYTSVAIRIPRRVPGISDPVYRRISEKQFRSNVLIYAKPGIGKTTVLRELAVQLSSGKMPRRVSVIDTRCELAADLDDAEMVDILSGYPRSTGIECAIRTMAPQYLICDEIFSEADAAALLSAVGSGVNLCVSVHADSRDALFRIPAVKVLRERRAFDTYVGLIPVEQPDQKYCFDIFEEEE